MTASGSAMVAGPDVPLAGNTAGSTTVGVAGLVKVVSWNTNGDADACRSIGIMS